MRNATRHLAHGFQPLRLSQLGFDLSLFRHVGHQGADGQLIPPLHGERPVLDLDDRPVRPLALEGIKSGHVAALEARLVAGRNPRQFAIGDKDAAVGHVLDFLLALVAENPRNLAVCQDRLEVAVDQDADIRLFDQRLKSCTHFLAFGDLPLQSAIDGFELDGLFFQFPHQRGAVLLDDVLIVGARHVRGFGAGAG